jgi:hypothetical protein
MSDSEILRRVLDFVRSLGIRVDERPIERPTLVSGIDIVRGGLVIEASRLCKPADILHEAGHIALTDPEKRPLLDGTIDGSPAEEMTAIGWTWAAAVHLGIDAADVFHDEVISGNGPWLRELFSSGKQLGLPMLQYWGLAARDGSADEPYPHMLRWVRE